MTAKERSSAYYQEHRLECIERAKAYAKEHPEQIKENLKAWKKAHRQENNAYNVVWKKAHPIVVKQGSWCRNDRNITHQREYSNAYQDEHPEQVKLSAQKYRESHKAQHKILKESLMLVKEGVIPRTACVVCGSTNDLKLYHLDYNDPLHVKFMCKECFWKATKERNRKIKLDKGI